MSSMISLLNQLSEIKTELENEAIDKDEASKRFSELIKAYHDVKHDDVSKWSNNFFSFFPGKDAYNHLRETFEGYLHSDDANDKDDRSQKLFLNNQMLELLTILNAE